MECSCLFSCVYLLLYVIVISAKDHDDLLNTCLDADFHKELPEAEPLLHGECSPWQDRACCEDTNTVAFHTSDVWLGFTWNHCPGHVLSDTCRKWFLKDLCFYECSPNVGPWIVEHVIRIRNERFLNAPLCESQCNSWWEDCKNDFTCWAIWAKGFNYTTGINTCPTGTTCRPFQEVWTNATTFCSEVWNYSWKVVPDSEPCLSINFTGKNPNDAVAKYYYERNTISVGK